MSTRLAARGTFTFIEKNVFMGVLFSIGAHISRLLSPLPLVSFYPLVVSLGGLFPP